MTALVTSDSANCDMRERLPVLILLFLLGALVWLRPSADRAAPQPLPQSSVKPWMADAIPGVGTKTRTRVAEDIRAGHVPGAARGWFSP